jgi:hypothetical protein
MWVAANPATSRTYSTTSKVVLLFELTVCFIFNLIKGFQLTGKCITGRGRKACYGNKMVICKPDVTQNVSPWSNLTLFIFIIGIVS